MKNNFNVLGEEYDDNITFITLINTGLCNLKCDYCLFRRYDKKFISYDTIEKIHNIFKDKKKDLYVYGGEPFLDKEIIQKLKIFDDTPITYQTNGNVDFFKQLKYLKDGDRISFSVHYTSNLNKMFRNIKMCQDLGCLGEIDFMYKDNIEIFKILKAMFKKIGFQVPFQYLYNSDSKEYLRRYDHYRDLKINNEYTSQFLYLSEHKNNSFKGFKCNCGRNAFLIDYNENVYRCEDFYVKNNPYTNLDNFRIDQNLCSSPICRTINATKKIESV